MPSLTSPVALEDMICRYAIELRDIPVPKELLPEAFMEILPDSDYVPTPASWEPVCTLAKELLSLDTVNDSEYDRFERLLSSTLESLGRKLIPIEILDPFHKILRDQWRSKHPNWIRSEYRYRLHMIRPELRHPDFGDTIKGVRVDKPAPVDSRDLLQSLVDSFYDENPESLRGDKIIKDIVEGKSLNFKSDLVKQAYK